MRRAVLFAVVLFGFSVMAVCGFYVLRDWAALGRAFARFEAVVAQNKDVRAVMIASDLQMTYRVNCFADGVGFLFGAVIAAIGVHGLCLLPAPSPVGNQKPPGRF